MSEFVSIKDAEPKERRSCIVMDKNGITAYAEPCFKDFKFVPCKPTKENKWAKKQIVWLDDDVFEGWMIDVTKSFGTLDCPMGEIIKWKYA